MIPMYERINTTYFTSKSSIKLVNIVEDKFIRKKSQSFSKAHQLSFPKSKQESLQE